MKTAENKKILAENILYYMDLKGVTKQQLCASLDIKYSTFVEWIKGRAYPRIGAVERLQPRFGEVLPRRRRLFRKNSIGILVVAHF